MKSLKFIRVILMLILTIMTTATFVLPSENQEAHDARMAWWREARFGMFIHWGLYSVPAGEWGGKSQYGEWIRTSAQIPLEVYDQFVPQFNPSQFNADQWVLLAKQAGMKYIVITSKHHDGFGLFDSKHTDFDIMATPFRRDILKALSEACRSHGLKMCWYHSIMDWHHPDYLPRRDWEVARPTEGADYQRYVAYMKAQLKELLTNYGEIGVLWFDGQWEGTWTPALGQDLYAYVRSLQPNIIINDRVGAGRSGMEGFGKVGALGGDFGTPEQQIPATGVPGVDWETCMTMNDHWGYNKADQNWKSTPELIRMLTDIASKGGNYLLNVGPTAEGLIPTASVERLQAIGAWMQTNGEAIYGTQASPFSQLSFGRCTQKSIPGGTRLYLHVFHWPEDQKLILPGVLNTPQKAFLLADRKASLKISRQEDAIQITVPNLAPDPVNSVIALEFKGQVDINDPPLITADFDIFIDALPVQIRSDREKVVLRYTTDGSVPNSRSPKVNGPVRLTETATVSARCFRGDKPVSGTAQAHFTRVQAKAAVAMDNAEPGLKYAYFEGDWDQVPDFVRLSPVQQGVVENITFAPRVQDEHFGFQYQGWIRIPQTGVYRFFTESDDGSQLYIDDQRVVDNDGLHALQEKSGVIALAAGAHAIRVVFFEKTGGDGLTVSFQGPGIPKQALPSDGLFHQAR